MRERILSKIDELSGYLEELESIKPENFEEYESLKTKRACERLLQISVECVVDICNMIVSEKKLGAPADEEDIIAKLTKAKIIPKKLSETIREMRGTRNILVHKYGYIDDKIIYKTLDENIRDFDKFIEFVLKFLKNK
ncbi:MAG: DUF86 domain-containing protein [Candidatus Aenigmarchaeota archaeon]|nr:DUF86 domain-containing protein [Candidatus Aenigmarchaeota archaeon]